MYKAEDILKQPQFLTLNLKDISNANRWSLAVNELVIKDEYFNEVKSLLEQAYKMDNDFFNELVNPPRSFQGAFIKAVLTIKTSNIVTTSLQWKCPRCNTLLTKGALGKFVFPGDNTDSLLGSSTCEACRAKFDHADIYGGRYDFQPADVTGQESTANCSDCGKALYNESFFDLHDIASRQAAVNAGLGFKCKKCKTPFCFDCLSSAPLHPTTGGRACPKCGGAIITL